ncbi:MAG: response regulator transcription factor [Gammaproteobacteria bacterium]|nr:response regulator transcription factor [Gammaproteobacteria bacterium]
MTSAEAKSPEQKPTVFVVDDDDAVRDALCMLLKSVGLPMEAYASATEFLATFNDKRPGCLLLDVRMPGMSGLELQARLNERGALLPIIFITGHGDVPMAVEAVKLGAFDFLQKPFRDQDLLDRLHQALERDAEHRKVLQTHAAIKERLAKLTPREREVLDLAAKGMPNKVIAKTLGLSPRTVEIHRAHVMEKMDTRSVAVLVQMLASVQS